MQEIELDREFVKRLAVMHQGNATAHLNRVRKNLSNERTIMAWTQHEMLGASGLVISASLWSLVDAAKAVEIYRRASTIYRQLDHSYWLPLALVSASDKTLAEIRSSLPDAPTLNAQTVAFGLISNELFYRERDAADTERLRNQWRHLGNIPVGRLGIPLDHYGQCADAMRDARHERRIGRFMEAAANYVRRAAEVVRGASHDRFHWRRLHSSILPAEPEAVAMTTAMSIMAHDVLKTSITEMSDLDRYGRLLVETGERMRQAIRDDQ